MADSYVHPLAIVEATDIGLGTRVWAFAHVLPGHGWGGIATWRITCLSKGARWWGTT